MIYKSDEIEEKVCLRAAEAMATAAKTAPKGCGVDKIETLILTGEDKDRLGRELKEIGAKEGIDFFIRDGGNIEKSHCVLLAGVMDTPLGLEKCGICGFANCGEMKKAGGNCTFNITDLGIAIGSAVSLAADMRIDNRVFYSAGKVAVEKGYFPKEIRVAYAIPLAASSKNIFFDRNPGAVLIEQENGEERKS